MKPSVGRIVHYTSFGSVGGKYPSTCRAALVTGVRGGEILDLYVINPTGAHFDLHIEQDEETKVGGTWHWPERAD